MITCCYTEINQEWSDQELADKLMRLPENLREAALRKTQRADRQLTVAGKLLLKEILNLMGKDRSLETLKFNIHHRPYFDGDFDFNIAHSGRLVVCAATNNGKAGIDIEQIKPIDFADYPDYFTANEWAIIRGYPNPFEGFYDLWTRKEAVLKAIGTGFHTPLSLVDVSMDIVRYDDTDYYLQKIRISPGYQCHIASTTATQDVKLLSVSL